MFFKNLTVWIFMCGILEIGIYGVSEYYNCSILQFEILKWMTYVLCYIILSIYLKKKEADENLIFRINCGGGITLAGMLSAISMIMILKSEKNVSWIIFLFAYVVTLILFFKMWKKGEVADEEGETKEESKNKKQIKILAGISSLVALGFARTASENTHKVVFTILLLAAIWGYLFGGLLFFISCKKELKNIFRLKNRD